MKGNSLGTCVKAFTYESHFRSRSDFGWPDFRNTALTEALRSREGAERLRESIQLERELPWYRHVYMCAWCHGAAGIGLTRLRAFEVTGAKEYQDDARLAIDLVKKAASSMTNFSLCHGTFGNDATLVAGSRLLGDADLFQHARDRALKAIEDYEYGGRAWPCGTIDGQADASLMLGESGIGMYLLSLHTGDIPSILLPLATHRFVATQDHNYAAPRSREPTAVSLIDLNEYFARSIQIMERIVGFPPPSYAAAKGRAISVATLAEEIADCIQNSADTALTELLIDGTRIDRARYAIAAGIMDEADTVLHSVGRAYPSDVDVMNAELSLSPFASLVCEVYDWDTWLNENTPIPAKRSMPSPFLLFRSAGGLSVRELSHFSYQVLEGIRKGLTGSRVVEELRDLFLEHDDVTLAAAVRQQLSSAYKGGVIDLRHYVVAIPRGAPRKAIEC